MNVFRVATFNLEWFFAKAPKFLSSPLAPVEEKAQRVAAVIAGLPERPHLLGVQEVQDEKVLRVLLEALSKEGLSFDYVLGGCSERTTQRVALLYDTSCVSLRSYGSYVYNKRFMYERLKRFVPSLTEFPDAELLFKNVYARCGVPGSTEDVLVVNVHFKAQYDPANVATREREAQVLQAFVANLRSELKRDAAVILMGDFNDFDHSIVDPWQPPPMMSSVLQRICTSSSIQDKTCPWDRKILFHNAAHSLKDKHERRSTVYGDLIDHILVDDRKIEVVDCRVSVHPFDNAKQEPVERTSDHFPLMATLKLKQ